MTDNGKNEKYDTTVMNCDKNSLVTSSVTLI